MSRRVRISQHRLHELARSLTPMDQTILDTLRRVRVASGKQLEQLHFDDRPSSSRQARRHLQRMVERRLLCRLNRRIGGVRAGSSGYVYALDSAGQRLTNPATPPSQPRRPWTPGVPFLAHALSITDLYVALTAAERQGRCELLRFDTEPTCWRSFADLSGRPLLVKPDAFVVVGVEQWEHRWFVELDLGTEGRTALTHKAEAYRAYWQSGQEQTASGVFPRVLFVVPDEARKAQVVDVLVRQPAEAWALFQVVLHTAAVPVLCGGRP